MSPSAHQCETVVAADRHQSARAAKRATEFEAKELPAGSSQLCKAHGRQRVAMAERHGIVTHTITAQQEG